MLDEKQQSLMAAVDQHRWKILDAERFIWKHPETGYREWETSHYLEQIFSELGYQLNKAGNIPGFYTDLETGRPGPHILIMSELDALICPSHPQSVNGNVHACGHHAQCAAMVGVATALKMPGALDGLCGTVRLMVVPAEELIEIEYRESLRREGVIRYYGGKVEFMHRGYMDGIDLAFMIHTTSDERADFLCNIGGNGCRVKRVVYEGVAAHAGGAPHEGVNALYAAQIGMQAINALRETFKDEDHIRVHPIITMGGSSVNIIPDEVRLESYVRGAGMDCIAAANRKVNRALASGAAAMGARVKMMDRHGYAPLNNDKNLMALAKSCMEALVGPNRVHFKSEWSTGCTDMGDLSCVMPAIHPYAAGATGMSHGHDYAIADPERACVNAAKAQVLMVEELLRQEGLRAGAIVTASQPAYPSIRAYLDMIDKVMLDLNAVDYRPDGSIQIFIKMP